jgi:Ser/Thr protein kinase RdoA (MazF antagonist)
MSNDVCRPPVPVLNAYAALVRTDDPIEFLCNAGGLSGARLWRFDCAPGRLLLRRWPLEVSGSRVESIHGWLRKLKALPFIAQPLPARDGKTFVEHGGAIFQVEPWLPGSPIQEPAGVHVRVAAQALGQVHSRLAQLRRSGPSPGLMARLAEIRQFKEAERERLTGLVHSRSGEVAAPLALGCLTRIREHAPRLEERLARMTESMSLQPCLRDCRGEHFLFVGNGLGGLIDYGAMAYESPAADLARLLATWVGTDPEPRAMALQAYATAASLPTDLNSLIDLFEYSATVLGPLHWIRWHFQEGRQFDNPQSLTNALSSALRRL